MQMKMPGEPDSKWVPNNPAYDSMYKCPDGSLGNPIDASAE